MEPHNTLTDCHADSFSADEILLLPTSSWDKKIAADLTVEMRVHFANSGSTLPEMRRLLAVKGYQGLQRRIERDIEGKRDLDALRTMGLAMRSYALEHPGLSAASFRTITKDSPECRQALSELLQTVLRVFADVGLVGESAQRAIGVLRGFVRGFVLNEMGESLLEPFEHQRSYELGIEVFIRGLSTLGAVRDLSK